MSLEVEETEGVLEAESFVRRCDAIDEAAPIEHRCSGPDERQMSQVIETSAPTPEGRHLDVTLARVSTGGTRRQQSFKRAASGPMTGSERAEKKRKRALLFPKKQAMLRQKDAERKRSKV